TAGVPFTSSQTGVSSTASSVVASGGMWGRCGKQRGGPRPTALLREAAACGRLREAVAKGDLREAATEPDGSAPAGSACRAAGPAAGRPHPTAFLSAPPPPLHHFPFPRFPIPDRRFPRAGWPGGERASQSRSARRFPQGAPEGSRPLPPVALRATLPAGRLRRPLPGGAPRRASAEFRAQRLILPHHHPLHHHVLSQCLHQPLEDESRQVFSRRHELSLGELRNVKIDVPMVE